MSAHLEVQSAARSDRGVLRGTPWQLGAQVRVDGVHYRVWAPDHAALELRILDEQGNPRRAIALTHEGGGFFAGLDAEGRAGDLYQFAAGEKTLADPASRYQPLGVEGPSQVVNPATFEWKTTGWRPPGLHGRVIYELHIGTFTPEGTFAAAIGRLDALVDLGVNTIQLLPVADFAGERNWGYDGVKLFAPAHSYGKPDDLRRLVDEAHARGLAVVLDVVYNHLGPVGNVLPSLGADYFHPTRKSIWGAALNFDGQRAEPVRQFFLQNAAHWLDEYRFDGLRLDATHAIEDGSPTHILAEIAALAQARGVFVIAEDERNDSRMLDPREKGGLGIDGIWADDFHHTVRVALTGQQESHFSSYKGTLAEWVATLDHGWLFHGQYFPHWKKPRGAPARHLPPSAFVYCISNHDQVGNRPLGERLHQQVSPEAYRAVSMLLCLSPYTPMLFMGQEWAASSPFQFFTDHPGELGEKMAENRKREFEHYGATYDADTLRRMPDPQSLSTFLDCKLRWDECDKPPFSRMRSLYRECLQLRARELVFQNPPRDSWSVREAGPAMIALRWRAPGGDWLLLVGIRPGEWLAPSSEFIRTGTGRTWKVALASEEHRFGGGGVVWSPEPGGGLRVHCPGAVLFRESAAGPG